MRKHWAAVVPIAISLALLPAAAKANSGDFSGGVAIGSGYAGVDTAPTNGMIVEGEVGIGTTSPQSPLEVDATSATIDINGTTTGHQTKIEFSDNNNSNYVWKLGSNYNNAGDGNFFLFRNSGSGNILFSPNGGGNVGINNTSPSYLLHVGNSSVSGIAMELQNSSGACTYNPGASSVTVSCSSDRRLKSDIEDSGSALSWIDDMRIRDFTVIATGDRKTGVIAQEMIRNHSDMVHENDDGYYSVDEPSPWMLVKTIQELHGMISKQQREIDELKQTIEQLNQHR